MEQTLIYRQVLDAAGPKRVAFRVLDIGGDKALPYIKHPVEDNPAIGWRAIRMSLDRPAMLRMQMRALLTAAEGRELSVMLPMVTIAEEVARARDLIEKERQRLLSRGAKGPAKLNVGAMIEVPSILNELDVLMPSVEFVSVGSNDLMQFLYAADRGNPRVANRYDCLRLPALRALRSIVDAGRRHKVSVTLCGEMAGRPLEAMALVGLGYRSLSLSPASIGPVKAMLMSLDASRLAKRLDALLAGSHSDLRGELRRYAEAEGVEI